ncbi:MAG: hypothetical protein FWG11_08690 [Promicromonosporaceae bacterium]|nr:hypothetical protein [Promicromonosporaceae bacterium]
MNPRTITIAGLVVVVAEFALASAELTHFLGDDAYAVTTFILGLLIAAATFILATKAVGGDGDAAIEDYAVEDDEDPEP